MKSTDKSKRSIIAAQRVYFKEYSANIAERNIKLMGIICISGIISYAVIFTVTMLFFGYWSISPLYMLIVPVMALFLVYSLRKRGKCADNPREVQSMTALLCIILIFYTILLSVFPHPYSPALYYPLVILVSPVLYILPAGFHISTTIGSLGLYYILVLLYKNALFWQHDLFQATVAAGFAIIVDVAMTQFRLSTDMLMNRYYNLSRTDTLTGVMNKAAGENTVRERLLLRKKGEIFSLMFIDIDNFKNINDTLGHIIGDKLLKKVGLSLSASFRRDDIVYRFGGDEFVLCLPDIGSAENAASKAALVTEIMHDIGRELELELSCSVGIYVGNGDEGYDKMLMIADSALYRAKNDGKNKTAVN